MNGSTENRASGASEKPGWHDAVLTWSTARRMLPLVRRIVEDILQHRQRLALLQREKNRLDRQRRSLAWPERARRYHLQEEIGDDDFNLQEALAELEVLGVALLDADEGQIGFPTLVNDHRAFFSWRPGEEGLHHWLFAGETARRPVPTAWMKSPDGRRVGRS